MLWKSPEIAVENFLNPLTRTLTCLCPWNQAGISWLVSVALWGGLRSTVGIDIPFQPFSRVSQPHTRTAQACMFAGAHRFGIRTRRKGEERSLKSNVNIRGRVGPGKAPSRFHHRRKWNRRTCRSACRSSSTPWRWHGPHNLHKIPEGGEPSNVVRSPSEIVRVVALLIHCTSLLNPDCSNRIKGCQLYQCVREDTHRRYWYVEKTIVKPQITLTTPTY